MLEVNQHATLNLTEPPIRTCGQRVVITVPLATYRGWGLRAAAFAGDDLCDAFGQKIAFHQSKDERLTVGDPRLSIEERYPTHKKYVREVTRAAIRLYRRRLLLHEDVQRYIEEAEASSIGT